MIILRESRVAVGQSRQNGWIPDKSVFATKATVPPSQGHEALHPWMALL